MELDIAQADFCRFNHFASQETRLLNKALDKALQEQDSLMLVRIGLIRSSRSKSKKNLTKPWQNYAWPTNTPLPSALKSKLNYKPKWP